MFMSNHQGASPTKIKATQMRAQPPKALAAILSHRLHLPPANGVADDGSDLKDVCYRLVSEANETDQMAILGENPEIRNQIEQWVSFANVFPHDDPVLHQEKLDSINQHLLKRSVLAGTGTVTTLADIAVYVAVYPAVASLSPAVHEKFPNLMRWFDYVQNKENVTLVFEKILLKKPNFQPYNLSMEVVKKSTKLVADVTTVSSAESAGSVLDKKQSNRIKEDPVKEAKKLEENGGTLPTGMDATPVDKTKTKDKKEKEEKPQAQKKDLDVSVSVLDIRVGIVRKVWKHPSADSLLVEEIDLGEGTVRQVVSGLAKYITEEEMLNRRVLVIANVKPGKLRDVMSAGLVLCASNEDHSVVEPLMPPDAAVIGERVMFAGIEGKAEDVLNPKKKLLEKILPDLITDDMGVATYQGIPFMTSAGACKSSLSKAAIK